MTQMSINKRVDVIFKYYIFVKMNELWSRAVICVNVGDIQSVKAQS